MCKDSFEEFSNVQFLLKIPVCSIYIYKLWLILPEVTAIGVRLSHASQMFFVNMADCSVTRG